MVLENYILRTNENDIMSIEKLIETIKAVSNDEDIKLLSKNFDLTELDRPDAKNQILGIYHGVLDGKSITVTHRWYDRCRVFQVQPDGNKVALEIDGIKVAEGSFLDDH